MARCKKCTAKSGVYGIEDAAYIEVASAVVGATVMGRVDQMATQDEAGAPRDNFLANNPMAKNALYVAAGLGITAFMQGEMYKGLGIGVAAYGGYNLVEGFLQPDTTTTVNGLKFMPPRNIAGVHGLRTLPGNYGVAPSIVAGVNSDLSSAEKYNAAMKTPIDTYPSSGKIVRAL
jgi:hypothetical protein